MKLYIKILVNTKMTMQWKYISVAFKATVHRIQTPQLILVRNTECKQNFAPQYVFNISHWDKSHISPNIPICIRKFLFVQGYFKSSDAKW